MFVNNIFTKNIPKKYFCKYFLQKIYFEINIFFKNLSKKYPAKNNLIKYFFKKIFLKKYF